MREISPALGRLILAALHVVPSRLAWPQYGRMGTTQLCVRRFGVVAWFEN